MQGLLNQAAPQQAPQQPPQGGPQPSGQMVDTTQLNQRMDKSKRMFMAMQRILYMQPTSEYFMSKVDGSPESVGMVVAAVVCALVKKVGPERAQYDLLVPVGCMLVIDLANGINEGDAEDDFIKEATLSFVNAIQKAFSGEFDSEPDAQDPAEQTEGEQESVVQDQLSKVQKPQGLLGGA